MEVNGLQPMVTLFSGKKNPVPAEAWSGRCREEKNLLPLTRIELPFLGRPSHTVVTIRFVYTGKISFQDGQIVLTASFGVDVRVKQKIEVTIMVKIWRECLLTWQQAPELKDRQEALVFGFSHTDALQKVQKVRCG